MAYSTATDLDLYSHIDDDTLVPEVKFTTAEKTDAIVQADARIDYTAKDWATYYTGTTLANVTLLIKEISVYYALYILFDKKAKIVMLMASDNNDFNTGDMSTSAADSDKKTFYVQYQALSQLYKIKADELIALVIPAGSDSIRSTFYFDMCKSVEEQENDDLLVP